MFASDSTKVTLMTKEMMDTKTTGKTLDPGSIIMFGLQGILLRDDK